MAKISHPENTGEAFLVPSGRAKNPATYESFAKKGYAVVRELVNHAARSFLYEYALKNAHHGKMPLGDDFIPGTPCCYADPFMESLLEILVPKVESITALRLFPTYSYFRVYKQGDILKRHKDRPSCEVSMTLSLGYQGEKPWPIWLEADGSARETILQPGDALLYKGVELPHWREPFMGDHSAQVFLHFVNQDGRFKEWKFDKRPNLSTSPLAKRIMEQFRFL